MCLVWLGKKWEWEAANIRKPECVTCLIFDAIIFKKVTQNKCHENYPDAIKVVLLNDT